MKKVKRKSMLFSLNGTNSGQRKSPTAKSRFKSLRDPRPLSGPKMPSDSGKGW